MTQSKKEAHPGAHTCKGCTEKEAIIADITDTAKRVQAEFENYQKRMAKEQELSRAFALEAFFKKLLPLLDSIDQAQKHASGDQETGKGITLINQQLWSILKEEGMQRMSCVGKAYDPHLAEVMLTTETEESQPSNIVLEEFQAGYLLGGKVLRHAKVRISVQKEHDDQANKSKDETHDA